MGQRVLVVDDEDDILALLERNLANAGFDVITASDGPTAIDKAVKMLPEMIILDIMLPDMDGTEVLKALKNDSSTCYIPVMMLTARGEEIDRVVGLELGADDYVVKPFSPRELLLRVNVLLKKNGREEKTNIVRAGTLAVDAGRFQAMIKDKPLKLTAAEFRLLSELVSSNGRVLSREYLTRRVCGTGGHITLRTVDAHVKKLRKKLGPYRGCVDTVRGLGYRFAEEVIS